MDAGVSSHAEKEIPNMDKSSSYRCMKTVYIHMCVCLYYSYILHLQHFCLPHFWNDGYAPAHMRLINVN